MKRKTNIFSENGILSGKRVLAATLSGVLFIGATIYSVAASDGLRSDGTPWKSTGDVVYEYTDGSGRQDTVFAKEDLDYIDDRITELKTDTTNGKRDLAQALNAYGYYKEADTSSIEQNATYEQLINAFSTSQSIPSGRTVNVDASGFIAESGGTETAVVGATAENISAGKAAWVDGELIIGNGADNKSYYAKGYTDGYVKNTENVDIRNVYHTHTDASGNSYSDNTTLTQLDNPGGCFKAKGHTHNEQCGKTTTQSACNNSGQYWDGNRCRSCGRIGSGSGACGGTIYKTSYTCGSPVNTWILGCNKNSSSIEKVEIIFK